MPYPPSTVGRVAQADTTVSDGARRTGYLAAGIAGILALLGGLLLAPSLGDLLFPPTPFALFPSLQNPYFNHPEPTEFTRYLFAAAAPAAAAAAVVLAGRRQLPARTLRAGAVFSGAMPVVVAVALIFAWFRRETIDHFFNQRYEYFSAPQALLAVLLAALIAIAAAHSWPRRLAGRSSFEHKAVKLIPLGALLVVVLFLLPVVQTERSFPGDSLFVSAHLTNTVADVEAVANGATPGVDVSAQYANLLPYLLRPLFEATGFEPASMVGFLTVLTGLVLIGFYRVILQITESELAGLFLFIPMVALSLVPAGGEGALVISDANTFQVLPIRYIGPALVAWLLVRHLRGLRPDVGRLGIFFVAGLAAINTPDFGSAAFIASVLALALLGAAEPAPLRRVLRVCRDALIGLVGAVTLFSVITLARSGSLPDPSILLYYPELFGSKGFGLVPMDTVGFYWFLYVTFAGALVLAAVRAVSGEPDRVVTGMLAFFSVLGLAAGVYYVGRTGVFTLLGLFPVWGMTLAMLSWLVIRRIAERPPALASLREVGVLGWMVLFGLGLAITATSWAQAPWRQVDRLTTEVDRPTGFEIGTTVAFVRDHTEPGEQTALMCRSSYLVAERAGVRNVSPIADPQHIAEDAQVGEIVDALRRAGGDKLFACDNPVFALPPEIGASLAARGFSRTDTDRALRITEWTSAPQGSSESVGHSARDQASSNRRIERRARSNTSGSRESWNP